MSTDRWKLRSIKISDSDASFKIRMNMDERIINGPNSLTVNSQHFS